MAIADAMSIEIVELRYTWNCFCTENVKRQNLIQIRILMQNNRHFIARSRARHNDINWIVFECEQIIQVEINIYFIYPKESFKRRFKLFNKFITIVILSSFDSTTFSQFSRIHVPFEV